MGTSTNVPRIKYTPLLTPNAEPVAVALSDTKVSTVSLMFKVVLPYVTVSSRIKISPSGKAALSPSSPDSTYFMNIVISSTPSVGGNMKFFIVATIPEF